MHSFTQEDLVQYLYNETPPEKAALLRVALQTNWILRENYEMISEAIESLEKLSLTPRKIAVDHILNYAKTTVKELPSEV